MVAQRATSKQHKRHGTHQKRTHHFLRVYSPYLPLAMILITMLVFSVMWQPRTHKNVLAYATSMSSSGLLSSTNQQRTSNNRSSLKFNSKLTSAAQAKANDMVKEDYWSHNSPDGKTPWSFINSTGYKYKAAGENLAYGFATSADTVAGWMNSASHKANLLSRNYTEVGFGIANAKNFQDDGEQTVVVAMYGQPQVLGATANSNPVGSSTAPKASSQPVTTPKSTASKSSEKLTSKASPLSTGQLATTPTAAQEVSPAKVSKFAVLSKGAMPWMSAALGLTLVMSLVVLAVRHSLAAHRWLRKGERYVLHHALFDVTVISLIGLIIIVNSSAGIIL